MGLPILLAAPDGEASNIVLNDKAGLHIAAEDPTALADSVNQLANNKSALKTFAAAALKAAPSHSRETQARELLNVFKKAMGGEI